jgi:tetratricopeptide (TPR) repeat protein
MATREHSRFVHFVLPWLVAAAGLLLFLLTLHDWVGFSSVEVVSRVAGWEWNTMQLGPVTLLVTWPVRWIPPAWQTPALNALSALLAAITLGLLAKCVALLPHDRTREQRQRERSDFSFLTVPMAWLPPVVAAAMLGLQLTFWEHATAMTGEMVTLTLFAFCIYCFLRFRVLQEDKYLAWLAFAFGAAAANDWGMVAFGPLFFAAIIWVKGVAFFDGRFLLRTTAAGIAGLLFYLVQPLALKVSGQAEGSFMELLRTTLSFQRQLIFTFPRWVTLLCSLVSVLPVVFIGIRWPSTFGDLSAAGAGLTNFLFRLIHAAFLAAGLWVMFDPPFSPRALGFGLPFLHFYFLTALVIGYALGYILLVFGKEPDRKVRRTSDGMSALGRFASGIAVVAALGATAALAVYNLPAIRGQNGPMVRELASTLLPPAGERIALLSDDNELLMLAVGLLREENRAAEAVPVATALLRQHVYQRHHERRYGSQWPALVVENLPNPIADDTLRRQIAALGFTNRLYYLHPSFGSFFETYYLIPTNRIYALALQPVDTYELPHLGNEPFEVVHRHWLEIRQRLVDDPLLERLKARRVADATRVSSHYARALNAWGVALQRRDRLEEAGTFFAAARQLNEDNFAAVINGRYNQNLLAGSREAVVQEKELNDAIGRYRDISTFLRLCGPVDEPSFCFRVGRVFVDGGLYRQAARQFARSLKLQPGSMETRLWLASASLSAGLYDVVLDSVARFQAAKENLAPAQRLDLIGLESWARYYKGDLEGAERLLLKAQEDFPDHLEPLQTLNDIYFAANRTNDAMRSVEKLVMRMPGNPRPLITKSALQIQIGQLEQAVETLTGVLKEHPEFFPALVNRALAYSKMGHLKEAEEDYLRLLEIAPELHMVYYHLAEIDYQRADVVSAKRHYRKFLQHALPGSPEARAAEQRLADIAAGKLGP